MKKLITVVLLVFLSMNFVALAQNWLKENEQKGDFNFKQIESDFNKYWQGKEPYKGSGYKQFKRMEWLLKPRLWKTNSLPELNTIYTDAMSFLRNKVEDNLLQTADWKPLGPNLKPTPKQFSPPAGMGRISCLELSPENNSIMYAGSATGGIWKSTNGGANWSSLDLSTIMSIGISDIAVSPTNPQIVFAGTGDADASGFLGTNFSYSVGVLKSTNAGQNWTITNLSYQISDKALINRVLVHPGIPDVVYAATSKGLFKTTNGGTNWTKINNEFCREIKFQPDNPSVIYCAFLSNGKYSIQKFTDGAGFQMQQEFTDAGRITFATNKKSPNTVYALVATSYPYFAFHSIWKTIDGYTWAKVIDNTVAPNYLSFYSNGIGMEGQGLYDLAIETNQNNSDEVYLGAVNVWKSTNGGKSFACIAEWKGDAGLPWVHADIHMFKSDNSGAIYACSDGGISKTTNNGTQWVDISNGLGITQFYSIACHPDYEYKITGGTQDNGTHYFDGTTWKNIYGGDGMITLFDYSNQNNIYCSLYNGTINKSTNGGNTFKEIISSDITQEEGEWVTPYMLHPTEPSTIYVAMQNVWKSTDGGNKWAKISDFNETQPLKIQAMAISPSNPNYIYVSKYNNIYRTTMGGGTWTLIGTMQEFVTSILVDPKVATRFWVTESGYTVANKVHYYDGQKWQNMSDGLPNVPVNCIEYQKNSQDRLYVGTDVGVFTKDNSNPTWEAFMTGLPNVIVNSLSVHYASGKLRAGTYGRGLWETRVVECNIDKPEVTVTGDLNFCDGDSVKLEAKSGFVSYLWSTGAKTRSITVKSAGSYSVTVTDAKNCSATSDKFNVIVTQVPAFTIKNIGTETICDNSFTELTVSSFAYKYYKWSNGDTTKKITVTKAGTYYCDCETADGCKKRSTNQITVNTVPAPAKPTIALTGDELVSSAASSYQWYMNDVKIDGETNRQLKPKTSGNYKVEIFDNNSCSNFSDVYSFSTDIEDIINGNYRITPNPTIGIVEVFGFDSKDCKVSLIAYSLTGIKLIDIEEVTLNNSIKLDFSNFETGIYFLHIKANNKSSIFKIIKTN